MQSKSEPCQSSPPQSGQQTAQHPAQPLCQTSPPQSGQYPAQHPGLKSSPPKTPLGEVRTPTSCQLSGEFVENKITRWHLQSVVMNTPDHCPPPEGAKYQRLVTLTSPRHGLKQLKTAATRCGSRLMNPSSANARGITLTAVLERERTPLILSAW